MQARLRPSPAGPSARPQVISTGLPPVFLPGCQKSHSFTGGSSWGWGGQKGPLGFGGPACARPNSGLEGAREEAFGGCGRGAGPRPAALRPGRGALLSPPERAGGQVREFTCATWPASTARLWPPRAGGRPGSGRLASLAAGIRRAEGAGDRTVAPTLRRVLTPLAP